MSYARQNNSTKALIDNQLYATGTCKNVRRGHYTQGPRAGQPCVAKEFKTGSVFADHYFAEELTILARAQRIVDGWHAARVIDRRIVLNTAEIWDSPGGRKVLVEPFIHGYAKFNSNTGWAATGSVWAEAMQALSHFSYHLERGQFLLCDLQGGGYEDG